MAISCIVFEIQQYIGGKSRPVIPILSVLLLLVLVLVLKDKIAVLVLVLVFDGEVLVLFVLVLATEVLVLVLVLDEKSLVLSCVQCNFKSSYMLSNAELLLTYTAYADHIWFALLPFFHIINFRDYLQTIVCIYMYRVL